ncbi:hypothetical protein L1987_16346 [Smallanthus sonchifolius]|uniref:Uncharacterized protein n=1 Tax=Smallanthus sonchifolius TaxID=185202 RepID=A0ACB9J9M2_9ASTR|nr:hypothetical protein L1987_16346 [Smallanthus sonchifolius]
MKILMHVPGGGVDIEGRPVMVVVGAHFLLRCLDLERFVLYVVKEFEPLIQKPYSIVYFHSAASLQVQPDLGFMRKLQQILGRKSQRNLHAIYILHPTFGQKAAILALQLLVDGMYMHSRQVYWGGVDIEGRPVMVVVGAHFLLRCLDLERFVLYVVKEFEPLIQKPYSIVYFHSAASLQVQPDLGFMRKLQQILGRKSQRNLHCGKRLYMLIDFSSFSVTFLARLGSERRERANRRSENKISSNFKLKELGFLRSSLFIPISNSLGNAQLS